MITELQKDLAEHEVREAGKPWVLLRQRGYQPGAGSVPGRMLWDVIGGDYCKGSTVTMETMRQRGYRVEVVG
jgi:hypothetical protein